MASPQQPSALSSVSLTQLAQITERLEADYDQLKDSVNTASVLHRLESSEIQDSVALVKVGLQNVQRVAQDESAVIRNDMKEGFKLAKDDIISLEKRVKKLEDRAVNENGESAGSKNDALSGLHLTGSERHIVNRLCRLEQFQNGGFRGHVAAMEAKFENRLHKHKEAILESLNKASELVYSKDDYIFELEKKVSDLTQEGEENARTIEDLEKKILDLTRDQNFHIGTIAELAGKVQNMEAGFAGFLRGLAPTSGALTRLPGAVASPSEVLNRRSESLACPSEAVTRPSEASTVIADSHNHVQQPPTKAASNKRKRKAETKDSEAEVKPEVAPSRKRSRGVVDPDEPLPSIEVADEPVRSRRGQQVQATRVQPARAMKGKRKAR